MYFKQGAVVRHKFKVDGFEFMREIAREDDHISILILTVNNVYVTETAVASLSDIETAEEIIKQDVYTFIEEQTDELDKIMSYFSKGWN
ncbi:DUF1108 family protein [Staphylococcus simulans]|uniref:DUF1108 family protein n=1 Tax=Staphylococcus simulans TaxID=1286 RepID=UPI000CD0A714|nr:DUF1108 family protein [Staphylococcus simulans]PNZ42309.1 hypothetical protein CD112_10110 [Staphylococcus simulans]SQE74895.1 Putative cytosolic protein [Staphylococcus simulans]